MSLNLGNRAGAALSSLNGNENWKTVRDELAELVSAKANIALDAAPELAATANAYVRGMRDLWVAFEAATTNKNQIAVDKPRAARANTAG